MIETYRLTSPANPISPAATVSIATGGKERRHINEAADTSAPTAVVTPPGMAISSTTAPAVTAPPVIQG
ncbi:hypothetical protein SUDANB151_02117 [Streptomyces sp. enrichment culture]